MARLTHFVWVADATGARRCRRFLAQIKPRVGVRVGTWVELLDQLRSDHLLAPGSDWPSALHECLAAQSDAFWAASYQVDPEGVAVAVEQAWRTILCSIKPGTPWPALAESPRIAGRLNDLNHLNRISPTRWPDDLAALHAVLIEGVQSVGGVRVYPVLENCDLNAWQRELVESLNRALDEDSELTGQLAIFSDELASPRCQNQSRLQAVQRHLGSGVQEWPADTSCQLVAVRDTLESIEVAAGSIQTRLAQDATLELRDIGLLLPDGFSNQLRLATIFESCGLPLSNLTVDEHDRDLGHELIRFALMRFEGPAPSMAIKALVSNPLMPWPSEVGHHLANTLEQFGFSLKPPRDLPAEHQTIVRLLEKPLEIDEVASALDLICGVLRTDGPLEAHGARAEAVAKRVSAAISGGERDWDRLRALCSPTPFSVSSTRDVNRQGICVMREGEIPLQSLRLLFVLDFADGHFPVVHPLSPVLAPDEWREVKRSGVPIVLPAEAAERARQTLRRQLAQVSEQLVLYVPQLNALGEVVAPSKSLMDFALLAEKSDEPEEILLDLALVADRSKLDALAVAATLEPIPPREPSIDDMHFEKNLLERYAATRSDARPISPSKLDTLLVSPLAWLLVSLGAEPQGWDPDEFDPLTNGSIAHDVFEILFPQGARSINKDELKAALGPAFAQSVQSVSPFLSALEWAVERDNLLGVIERAADAWADMLHAMDATVLDAETDLRGRFDGVAIHGQADAILQLPDAGLVVVDYKNAGSVRYQARMAQGMDLQTALYREMLRTGGPKDQSTELAKRMKGMEANAVMYFTMRDQKACANFPAPGRVAGWRDLGINTSQEGLGLLQERFADLRRGVVRITRRSEQKRFEKAKIGLYALELSPLTAVVLDDVEGAE